MYVKCKRNRSACKEKTLLRRSRLGLGQVKRGGIRNANTEVCRARDDDAPQAVESKIRWDLAADILQYSCDAKVSTAELPPSADEGRPGGVKSQQDIRSILKPKHRPEPSDELKEEQAKAAQERIKTLDRQSLQKPIEDFQQQAERDRFSSALSRSHIDGLWEIGKLMPISEPLWERIVLTVDSGASDTVIPPSVARKVPMLMGTKIGTQYEVANGGVISNLGEKRCVLRTGPGSPEMLMTFQVVEVHKPLLAVSKIVEAGNSVCFEKEDPHIKLKGGGKIPMRCVNGTYEIELWVKNEPGEPDAGFNRPSR